MRSTPSPAKTLFTLYRAMKCDRVQISVRSTSLRLLLLVDQNPRQCQEEAVDVVGYFGRGFREGHIKSFSKLLALLRSNNSIHPIALVSN